MRRRCTLSHPGSAAAHTKHPGSWADTHTSDSECRSRHSDTRGTRRRTRLARSLASRYIQADSPHTSGPRCRLDTGRSLCHCSGRVWSPADYSYTLCKHSHRPTRPKHSGSIRGGSADSSALECCVCSSHKSQC